MAKLTLLTKLAPESGAGKVKNITTASRIAFSGIGVDQGLKFADNILTRGMIQSFGINLPFIGRLSGIDIIDFIAHNNGNIVPKSTKPFIAFGAAKIVQGGRLNIPGATAPTTAAGASSSSGVGF